MIIILSPAKTLDFSDQSLISEGTEPVFREEADQLVTFLKKLSFQELSDLLKTGSHLTHLNQERYAQWQPGKTPPGAKQCILAYKGEAYTGLAAEQFSPGDFHHAQDHLRILSGLYGMLRPLDRIQPYRLEMQTGMSFGAYESLYDFWSRRVTKALKEDLERHSSRILVNLASNEYSKVVVREDLNTRVITPVFMQRKGDEYKTVTVYAKRARGMLSRYIITHRIDTPDDIVAFDEDGYHYNGHLSSGDKIVFTRG